MQSCLSQSVLGANDRAAHDWYRFVLLFPPHLVRDYLHRFKASEHTRVLDPFCGTGTTVVECKKQGIPSVGVEVNPVAVFAGEVKTDWTPDPVGLSRHADRLADIAHETLRTQGLQDKPLFQMPPTTVPLLDLPAEKWKLLLKDSISPLPLHKTLVLLNVLKEYAGPRYARHEMLALAKALPFSISNLRFGPEVGLGSIKSDTPVIEAWRSGVQAMCEDLRLLQKMATVSSEIHHADSRDIFRILPAASIDAVITSPPYPNEKDYTRTTRLESVLLEFINDKEELRALKHGLVRSNTRGVYKGDDDDKYIAGHEEIDRIADAIERRRVELGKTSGFERLYARVTKLYFGGMARHLKDLQTVLRPGAYLAYVVGDQASYLRVMIRTGQILGGIAQSMGYELVGIDLFRTRMATATKEQLREEVVVLRWPG